MSEDLETRLRRAFERTVAKRPDRSGAGLLVHSDQLGIGFRAGADGPAFHIASVGKLFTTVLIARLVEDGKLSFEQPVAQVLDGDLLDGLFVVDGVDYRESVTIDHLLAHTSGVADYFEDRGDGGVSVPDCGQWDGRANDITTRIPGSSCLVWWWRGWQV